MPLAHLHASIAIALVCTVHSMSHMRAASDDLTNAMPHDRWLHVGHLSLAFAHCPGELSRVSQVPFSCASLWQGLRFAIQIQLGESPHHQHHAARYLAGKVGSDSSHPSSIDR